MIYPVSGTENEGWSCQVSINSDELSKVASPFDDIGYLPTNIDHGKSFKIKDGCSSNSRMIYDNNTDSSIKSKKSTSSTAISRTQSNSSHDDRGPSLNDFLTSNKSISGAMDAAPKAPEGGIRAPMRGRRGQLHRATSRRGDIANTYNSNDDDDGDDDNQSLGMSTIVSRFTMRSKAARSIFDISKTSLTLSMLGGGGNKSSRNDSRTFSSKGGSKHNSNLSDPSNHSLSKTNRTMTTNTTMTTLTKSASGGSFGSSMFARDPSNTKEKMRELIGQLQTANKSLIEDKQALISRVDDLTDALEKASFLHDWFSVMELAEANTELCKFRTMYERSELERERLKELVHPLGRQVHKLIAENEEKNDRIAYLEARLVEHQLPYTHSHHDEMGEGQESQATLESADSFGTFACDDDCYEQNLKSDEFENADFGDDERMFEGTAHMIESSREGYFHKPYGDQKPDREALGDALTRLEGWNCGNEKLTTLQEMAEHHDSFRTGKSNESSEHRNKTIHKFSGMTLGTAISNASTQQASNLTEKVSGRTMCSDEHSERRGCRKEVYKKNGMDLSKYVSDASTLAPACSDELMETGSLAMCDEIISVLPEPDSKHGWQSQTTDRKPDSKKKMKGKRSKSPRSTPKSPARRTKDTEKAVAEANNGKYTDAEMQTNAANVSLTEGSSTVISSSRISSEKSRRVRSTSVGNRKRLSKENSSRKLTNESDHITEQIKTFPVRRSISMGTGDKPIATNLSISDHSALRAYRNDPKSDSTLCPAQPDFSRIRPLKQPSRRKLRAEDPLGSSTHSNKSSKSSKVARRRAGSISNDPTMSVESSNDTEQNIQRSNSDDIELWAVASSHSLKGGRPRKPVSAGKETLFSRRATMDCLASTVSSTQVPGSQRRSSTGMEGPILASNSEGGRQRQPASNGKDLFAGSNHSTGARQRKPTSGGRDLGATSTHSVGGRQRKSTSGGKDLLGSASTHSLGRRKKSSTTPKKERMTVSESMDKLIGKDFSTEHLRKTSIRRNASFGSVSTFHEGNQRSDVLGVKKSNLFLIDDNAVSESSHLTALKSQYAPY